MERAVSRPKSDGHFVLSLVGLALCLPFAVVASAWGASALLISFGCIALYAMPQLIQASAAHREAIRQNFNLVVDRTVLTKLLALYLVLGLFGVLIAYWSFYDQVRFLPTKAAYAFFGPAIALLAIPYFCTVNRMQTIKEDEYYSMGSLLTGHFANASREQIRHFWLGWFVKLFFFPLMFWELTRSIVTADPSTFSSLSFISIAKLVYIADVVIASAGYLFTLRLFGWQIRSVNPFFTGWFFALLCYYPFFTIARELGLAYEDGLIWSDWLRNQPITLAVWGSVIIFLKLCWIYAISPFGLRFSNLTNRGIITDGAFRWTKHPSYISKNLFWWMIYVPFVTTGPPQEAVRNCAILFLMNCIYYCRAKTEERHLAEEPKYVAYSEWIEQHGLLALIRKRLRAAIRQITRNRRASSLGG